jgi:hypothetical protein
MTGDAIWYEAAQVVGITNALNVAADGLGALGPVDDSSASTETRALFAEIRAFYGGSADVPQGFRFIANDPPMRPKSGLPRGMPTPTTASRAASRRRWPSPSR